MFKALDHFSDELAERGNQFRLMSDPSLYCLRIAKAKKGKPDTDFPGTFSFYILNSKSDLYNSCVIKLDSG